MFGVVGGGGPHDTPTSSQRIIVTCLTVFCRNSCLSAVGRRALQSDGTTIDHDHHHSPTATTTGATSVWPEWNGGRFTCENKARCFVKSVSITNQLSAFNAAVGFVVDAVLFVEDALFQGNVALKFHGCLWCHTDSFCSLDHVSVCLGFFSASAKFHTHCAASYPRPALGSRGLAPSDCP